jgi:hypothetical protein
MTIGDTHRRAGRRVYAGQTRRLIESDEQDLSADKQIAEIEIHTSEYSFVQYVTRGILVV